MGKYKTGNDKEANDKSGLKKGTIKKLVPQRESERFAIRLNKGIPATFFLKEAEPHYNLNNNMQAFLFYLYLHHAIGKSADNGAIYSNRRERRQAERQRQYDTMQAPLYHGATLSDSTQSTGPGTEPITLTPTYIVPGETDLAINNVKLRRPYLGKLIASPTSLTGPLANEARARDHLKSAEAGRQKEEKLSIIQDIYKNLEAKSRRSAAVNGEGLLSTPDDATKMATSAKESNDTFPTQEKLNTVTQLTRRSGERDVKIPLDEGYLRELLHRFDNGMSHENNEIIIGQGNSWLGLPGASAFPMQNPFRQITSTTTGRPINDHMQPTQASILAFDRSRSVKLRSSYNIFTDPPLKFAQARKEDMFQAAGMKKPYPAAATALVKHKFKNIYSYPWPAHVQKGVQQPRLYSIEEIMLGQHRRDIEDLSDRTFSFFSDKLDTTITFSKDISSELGKALVNVDLGSDIKTMISSYLEDDRTVEKLSILFRENLLVPSYNKAWDLIPRVKQQFTHYQNFEKHVSENAILFPSDIIGGKYWVPYIEGKTTGEGILFDLEKGTSIPFYIHKYNQVQSAVTLIHTDDFIKSWVDAVTDEIISRVERETYAASESKKIESLKKIRLFLSATLTATDLYYGPLVGLALGLSQSIPDLVLSHKEQDLQRSKAYLKSAIINGVIQIAIPVGIKTGWTVLKRIPYSPISKFISKFLSNSVEKISEIKTTEELGSIFVKEALANTRAIMRTETLTKNAAVCWDGAVRFQYEAGIISADELLQFNSAKVRVHDYAAFVGDNPHLITSASQLDNIHPGTRIGMIEVESSELKHAMIILEENIAGGINNGYVGKSPGWEEIKLSEVIHWNPDGSVRLNGHAKEVKFIIVIEGGLSYTGSGKPTSIIRWTTALQSGRSLRLPASGLAPNEPVNLPGTSADSVLPSGYKPGTWTSSASSKGEMSHVPIQVSRNGPYALITTPGHKVDTLYVFTHGKVISQSDTTPLISDLVLEFATPQKTVLQNPIVDTLHDEVTPFARVGKDTFTISPYKDPAQKFPVPLDELRNKLYGSIWDAFKSVEQKNSLLARGTTKEGKVGEVFLSSVNDPDKGGMDTNFFIKKIDLNRAAQNPANHPVLHAVLDLKPGENYRPPPVMDFLILEHPKTSGLLSEVIEIAEQQGYKTARNTFCRVTVDETNPVTYVANEYRRKAVQSVGTQESITLDIALDFKSKSIAISRSAASFSVVIASAIDNKNSSTYDSSDVRQSQHLWGLGTYAKIEKIEKLMNNRTAMQSGQKNNNFVRKVFVNSFSNITAPPEEYYFMMNNTDVNAMNNSSRHERDEVITLGKGNSLIRRNANVLMSKLIVSAKDLGKRLEFVDTVSLNEALSVTQNDRSRHLFTSTQISYMNAPNNLRSEPEDNIMDHIKNEVQNDSTHALSKLSIAGTIPDESVSRRAVSQAARFMTELGYGHKIKIRQVQYYSYADQKAVSLNYFAISLRHNGRVIIIDTQAGWFNGEMVSLENEWWAKLGPAMQSANFNFHFRDVLTLTDASNSREGFSSL